MMAKIKYVIQENATDVKTKLIEIISREIKKDYVKTAWDKMVLCIKIEKMGSSEIRLALNSSGEQTLIEETKRSIAMMHKPFIADVEKVVENILQNKLGAQKITS